MSKFAALTHKMNRVVMDTFGDPALYRIAGMPAVSIRVIHETRDTTVFDMNTGSSVSGEQIWFWIEHGTFIGNYRPRVGDEIVFEENGYGIVEVKAPADGGTYVRVHQEELSEGDLYRAF